MPFRAEFRQFYGHEWRTVTRPRILARAGNACEQCRVPNHEVVGRDDRYPGWWFRLDGRAYNNRGELAGYYRGSDDVADRLVKIVLTIAHLNQTPGDDRDENLKALCQYCHLAHDRLVNNRQARETREARKDAERPLLQLLASPESPTT